MARWHTLRSVVVFGCLALVLALAAPVRAQSPLRGRLPVPQVRMADVQIEPATGLERVLSTKMFAVTDNYPMGEIPSGPGMEPALFDWQVVVVSDPMSRRVIAKGIRVSVEPRVMGTFGETAFVDAEELGDLALAIDTMLTLPALSEASPSGGHLNSVGSRDVAFTTKGRFSVGYVETNGARNAVFAAGMNSPLRVTAAHARLVDFRARLTQAIEILAAR